MRVRWDAELLLCDEDVGLGVLIRKVITSLLSSHTDEEFAFVTEK